MLDLARFTFSAGPRSYHRRIFLYFLLIIFVVLNLAACAEPPVVTPANTSTPDPCAPGNILAQVKTVNDLQRQFDDASQLAAVTPFGQLPGELPALQALRRQAQDQTVPACLAALKTLQLQQMNMVIDTFLAFLAGGSTKPDIQLLSQGIGQARDLHTLYNQELSRLIGATFVPPATVTPGGATGTAGPTSVETLTTGPAETATEALASSAGNSPVDIRAKPDTNAATLAWMDPGKTIAAIGKTADGLWIEVSDPFHNLGWALASDVKLTDAQALPVVTPQP